MQINFFSPLHDVPAGLFDELVVKLSDCNSFIELDFNNLEPVDEFVISSTQSRRHNYKHPPRCHHY